MVTSSDYDQYTPFPKAAQPETEGFQSSGEESELYSPVFEQPLAAFLPMQSRYQPIASDCLLAHDSLIAPPYNSQCYVQSQGFGAHHQGFPKEPSNTAMSYNASVQSHPQSLTSSAYDLAMPHCIPLLMNSALSRSTTSVDVPPSVPQISSSSHFHPPHPSATPSAPIPPTDTIDPSTSVLNDDDPSVPSSSRGGPPRNASSGVIACRQCRSRKIRCDSTRPNCQNCIKRGNECVYDKVPKRRGPDKRPGTRKRSCKKRQSDGSDPQPKKKRRADPVDQGTTAHASFNQYEISPVAMPRFGRAHQKASKVDTEQPPTASTSLPDATASFPEAYYVRGSPSPSPTSQPTSTPRTSRHEIQSGQTFVPPLESGLRSPELSSYGDPSPLLADAPSVQYPRKVWWDDLLDTYAQTREQALKDITNDLNSLFTSSSHWLTFFNVHWFLRDLFDSGARTHLQPALVYACLAMATLVRSSEIELGANGRARALRLRDAAQTHLRESWNLQWIDLGLAEAAMVLALFETSAHPQHDDASVEAALILLDKIIEALQLTALDARDPDTLDHSTGVPTVAHPRPPPKQCECTTSPADGSTAWSFQPAWDPLWTEAEVKSEETRRLCWSALVLVSNHTVARAAEQREPLNLFLVDPSNFRLLFPGEYHQRREYVALHSGKDTVWALYCRSMLLWNCTVRFWDERLTTEERTRIACAAFVETRVLEEALDAHVCNIDTSLIYMCREFISNIRLEVTYLTRSILLDLDIRTKPIWNRRLAEEWLFYQEQVARRIRNPLARLTDPSAHVLRHPIHISWFANQVATCLALWESDRDLLRALELAKTFLTPAEVLNSLWPCQAFHLRGKALRAQLSQACASAGISPPLPPTPPELSPHHSVTRGMTSSR